MAACPNPECHEDIALQLGKKADKQCLDNYIRKPHIAVIIMFATLIFVPTAIAAINIWAQQKVNPYTYQTAIRGSEQRERIIALEENYKSIQKALDAMNKKMEYLLRKSDGRRSSETTEP
jgi:hypothetical protein